MHRRPRQNLRRSPRVTSCQLCRDRKLRCNRQFPCSNCTARRVSCQAPSAVGRQAAAAASATEKTLPSSTPQVSQGELLKRLESLEALVAAQTRDPEAECTPRPDLREDGAGQHQHSPPSVLSMLSDALVLGRHCMGSKAGDSDALDPIVFRTCPIRLITRPYSFIFPQEKSSSVTVSEEPIKCVWLPERQDTTRILDKYLHDISFIHHVIHAPTVKLQVDRVHDAVDLGRQPPMGPVALLLAIFANATGLWTARDLSRNLFWSVSEAHSQASVWQRAGLDILDHLQQDSHVSLEVAQAMVILCYSVVNLEGVSAKFRGLFSRAVTMARELGLHCIDSPQRLLSPGAPRFTPLEAEIGRRVWWYLCSSDWIVAGLSGTLGNVYMINPSHMAVGKPRNIDDEDLVQGKDIVGKPMDQPTCMSFFLQRIRLGEIFHASLERAPQFAALSPEAISFQQVQELDTQLARFWDDTPAFLRLNHDLEAIDDGGSNDNNSAGMKIQRYILHLFIHGQRCKLHLPYLSRGASYPTSRAACVESARFIIRLEQKLEKEEADFASSRLRLSIVLHHIYLAFVVLLFDICLDSNDDGSRHISMSPEAAAAWKILEDAKAQLQQAEVLVEPLRKVMRRYRILHAEEETPDNGDAQGSAPDMTSSAGFGHFASTDTMGEATPLVQDWTVLGEGLVPSNDDWSASLGGLFFPLL
ncbi:hypothetical protein ACJZ2D_013593 [Fusarium nematophilum]